MQEVHILPLKKASLRHLSRLSKKLIIRFIKEEIILNEVGVGGSPPGGVSVENRLNLS